MHLEAFNNSNYNNNDVLEHNVPFYKKKGFDVIKFSDIKKEYFNN